MIEQSPLSIAESFPSSLVIHRKDFQEVKQHQKHIHSSHPTTCGTIIVRGSQDKNKDLIMPLKQPMTYDGELNPTRMYGT
jgi:hypothetical protein